MNDPKAVYQSIEDVPPQKWESLAGKTIYFGHMSVGRNILSGLESLMQDHPQIALNIVETSDLTNCAAGALHHSNIGENRMPLLKIKDFEQKIQTMPNCTIDIALFKFCYVDITADTDIAQVFKEYDATIKRIQSAADNLTLIHTTVPLIKNQTGIKALVKKIIGKPIYGVADNIKRYEYNQMVLTTYGKSAPVFDIAAIESTRPNGDRATFSQDGQIYYQMAPEYTTDGGHLNEFGSKVAAARFLLLLVNSI